MSPAFGTDFTSVCVPPPQASVKGTGATRAASKPNRVNVRATNMAGDLTTPGAREMQSKEGHDARRFGLSFTSA